MKKTVKRLLIIILVLALVAAGIWGVMTIIRNSRKKPVNVFSVSAVAMTGYYGDMNESYGMVTTRDMQKIFVSDTQTVTHVYVSEGQQVQKGDPLFKYDTTLSDIDLKKAEIDLEKKKLEKDTTQKELSALYNAVSLESLQAQYDAVANEYQYAYEAEVEKRADAEANRKKPPYPALPTGKWTISDPRYVNADDAADLLGLFSESGMDDIYVVYVTVQGTEYTEYHGIHLTGGADAPKIGFFSPAPLEREGESGDAEDEIADIDSDELRFLENQMEYISGLMANSYPREEILRMQNEKERRLGELDIEIRMADVELQRKQKEKSNGEVLAEIDGIVKSMQEPYLANENNEPTMVVSGGGGYYINATVSEMDLTTVKPGQVVTVNSWSTGTFCTGIVDEVGNEPAQETGWSSGNNNVSWYPLIIYVDEEENLREGDYANIQYEKSVDSSNTWYLQNMFIRQENGQNYVYMKGEDGLLKKQFLQTGKDLWGSYTEIKAGLGMNDFIAFPYGNDVTEGAQTNEADVSTLYNGF